MDTTTTQSAVFTVDDNNSASSNNAIGVTEYQFRPYGTINTSDHRDITSITSFSENVSSVYHDWTTASVHDKDYDFAIRVSILYVQIVLGTIGGVLVFVWMLYNRRLRSRVNALILNLCVADVMVMYLGCTMQLAWEYSPQREWLAGDLMCRLMKFLMIFANCASTNMLVVIAIDRHQAIRAPLREPRAVSQ